ncbi:MAG: PilZ domain-containing protein [Myxococcales bacterium]|nr:PilZ domain-containing protein [Myxococcales bacterium]
MIHTVAVETSIGLVGDAQHPCVVEHIDEVGARVRVAGGVRLPETSAVLLWIGEGPQGSAVVVPAYTGWPDDNEEDWVCDLYFAEPNALQRREQAGVDRRTSIRVSPEDHEVEVWLSSDRPGVEDPVKCRLVDLSEGGMCIELALGEEPITPFTGADFQILLPGEAWPLVMFAQVRHRHRQSREMVRYGLQFDRQRTQSFEDQRPKIGNWVARRLASLADRLGRDAPDTPDPEPVEA